MAGSLTVQAGVCAGTGVAIRNQGLTGVAHSHIDLILVYSSAGETRSIWIASGTVRETCAKSAESIVDVILVGTRACNAGLSI